MQAATPTAHKPNHDQNHIRFLQLLAKQYPNIDSACSEIINLRALLGLPKGTEHFLSDLHGEYEHFIHLLKNGSGVVKRKIEDIFGSTLTKKEKRTLAILVYYPERKIPIEVEKVRNEGGDVDDWFRVTINRMVHIFRVVASKYSRSRVREFMPPAYANVIEELLHERENDPNKEMYYNEIIESVIELRKAKDFITILAELIQDLAIFRLHIIGDIYDRGPGADIIMDRLLRYHSVDVQYGNHDIVWMGAAAGSKACMANVLRVSLRYSNLDTLEKGYGINILPLATFAMDMYGEDPCEQFVPKEGPDSEDFSDREIELLKRMHKAITIIQFKLEGQVIKRRPEFRMEDRLLLDKIDLTKGIVTIDGTDHPLNDTFFPTLDPQNPYKLTEEEQHVVHRLMDSFQYSDKLQTHTKFLFSKGGLYLTYNSNLLYHGCIPMEEDGSFSQFTIQGKNYNGKAFMDRVEQLVQEGYFGEKGDPDKLLGLDLMWYLWTGARSPIFGKTKMATFERYFINDESTWVEEKNAYYNFRDDEEACKKILCEFGLDPNNSHIVNGHVPVKVRRGESPIKANGRLLVIDGGFAEAYQEVTGIGGYTLIYNSYGLLLAAHKPFESIQRAVEQEQDVLPDTIILEKSAQRKRVRDTDHGRELLNKIEDLNGLVEAYRKGLIKPVNV